ncbi:hypothetical protein ESY86_00480 [Subsaximicrobium wynnwilliamsii]|uniref:Uncharacterized protein n=1 Tax=Subsaximicrobium wynnwilliamsii TaxID=291179 RepID=A0A5C6ZNA7_9FLAO|nr:hypothetical protein ESY87_01650 [Subsaximicrobium wynnwilliamsii]TXD91105.1 hypothetical protein ESY86_00480 [Subsaximicrobium wynnwilliamsii]TXE04499.1 hypothetical protein ESY88_03130 [Subsaximicrobium wynnwilliamsii]
MKQWKNEFLHKALAQIRLFLRQQPYTGLPQNSKNYYDDSIEKEIVFDSIGLIIDFLKTGNFKNSQDGKKLDQILKEIEWNSQNRAEVLKVICTDVQSILRFVFSMPVGIRENILGEKRLIFYQVHKKSDRYALPNPSKKLFVSELNDFLEVIYRAESLPNGIQQNFSQILKTNFEVTEKEYQKWLDTQTNPVKTKFKKLEALKNNMSIKADDVQIESDTNEESYYISNAGLIILHPFLQKLFEKLGYLTDDKNSFKSKNLQNRAVLLSQYLVTFEEQIFENDLVFNKVLCGVKMTDAINTKITFSIEEKEVCRDLLIATISHWKILKNTSPESLQSSFLQRKAKLKKDENNWGLFVEKQGLDVLLNHLPWGINTVRTPWMNRHLTCNWSR